jgi:aerobic carbon-monoxide dehydrogenase medium subunit
LKPAPFSHHAPTHLAEALDLLARHGSAAKALAGGQSLVPALNFRLARFDVLVDLNRIAGLAYIRHEGQHVRIGAMTRQREIEVSPLIQQRVPLLSEATRMVAHLPIRTRGTIGGSLSHADPAAEYPAVVLALDGVLVLQSNARARRVPAAEFFRGLFSTAMEAGELLVEIEIPVARPHEGFAFDEVSRRRGDFAIAGVAAAITVRERRIVAARLAACGVGAVPLRLTAAEELLVGKQPEATLFRRAAAAAASSVSPQGDLHADADYRRRLLHNLVQAVAARAVQRAEDVRT